MDQVFVNIFKGFGVSPERLKETDKPIDISKQDTVIINSMEFSVCDIVEAMKSTYDLFVCEECGEFKDKEDKSPYSDNCKDCCEEYIDEMAKCDEIDRSIDRYRERQYGEV